jgi:cell surface protein SprA
VDTFGGTFRHLNPMRMGTVTVSYLPIRTMRDREGQNGANSSATFEQFEANRLVISQRIGQGVHDNPNDNPGYTNGYGRVQQDVLIPAFLAAYNGQDANTVKLSDIRQTRPLPNWRLTYNGLAKLKPFSKWFASFSLTHGYKSTLTVNRYATDLDFEVDPNQKDPRSQNFYSQFEIPNIVISEQFNPLIGIDMRLKNELTFRFNYKSSRNLSMSFVDYQLSQTTSEDITIGFGKLFKNFKPSKLFGKKKEEGKDDKNAGGFNFDIGGKIIPKNELNVKFDFSYRDDKTINHVLDQRNSVATRGMKTIRIAPSIDYIINNKMTLRFFYDYNRTIPAVQTSFPITATRFGVTFRFMLSQ